MNFNLQAPHFRGAGSIAIGGYQRLAGKTLISRSLSKNEDDGSMFVNTHLVLFTESRRCMPGVLDN